MVSAIRMVKFHGLRELGVGPLGLMEPNSRLVKAG
ncbi:hypothetical protein COLO4_18653 [Corchorus olitorius]|uniref:Uncharacterized protein n=1 Tax=Corchorus olitorius TaxID=93759 RepID=A0A1R3J8F6_9ROSI|nr:hypothetical protein COLO4_18653 [Corchorus olitorius]